MFIGDRSKPGRSVYSIDDLRASALHLHRTGALRPLVLAHDTEAPRDVGVGFEQATHVATEAVLVELLVGLEVSQPARIRRQLVGDHDPHQVVFPKPAAFHLEVFETDADAEEKTAHEIVNAYGKRHH